MRNDFEPSPEISKAGPRRGGLAGVRPHWPKLTVSRKLWLGFGILLLFLIVGGIFIERSIRTIEANLKEITEIEEPESAAAFEMEISLIGTGFAVLGYLHDRDPAHLARIEDDKADFAYFQQQYHELALQASDEEELRLAARVDEGYLGFTAVADGLIFLEDLQFEKTGLFLQNLDQMDEILDDQIQASLDPSDPASNMKLHTAHEMEINASGIAKGLGNYLRTQDGQYERRVYKYEADFEQFIATYESLSLSPQERQWAHELHVLFDDSVGLAKEIIDLDKAKELGVANFIQLSRILDILLDDEIQTLTQAELAEAKAEAQQSINSTHWALLALLIAGLAGGGVAIIIGRGISKPLGKLAAGVEHVSAGDLTYVIDIDSSDEISELAVAFNRMTTNLAHITASRDELDKEIEERKQAEQTLLSIVEGTSAATGDGFFQSLVRHLASALDVRYVLVGEVIGATADRVRTLAVWAGDDFGESFEYCLAGTPCDNVIGQAMCLYPREVQKLFPQDHLLVEMGVESYLGTPLFDSSGRAVGLLAVLDDMPMAEMSNAQSILAIFAARAGAELERKRTENALKRSLEAERERARRDSLTGTLNHGAITEALREACAAAEDKPLAVAMIDLDGLKAINDTYGHQVGDKALNIVANVLARENAIVGRYGGDEFIVILPGADRGEADRYREVVTAKLLDVPLLDPETDAKIQIVASWGLAVFPEEAETIVDLIRLSDSAMYAAKRQRPISPDATATSRPLPGDRAATMVGQIVPLLTSFGDLTEKMQLVARRLAVGAGYDAVNFTLFNEATGQALTNTSYPHVPQELVEGWDRAQQPDSKSHPLTLLLTQTLRPVILDDPWNDERLWESERNVLRAAQLRSVLVAPMVWRDELIGTIGVASKQPAAFGADDAQFLIAIATQVTAIVRMETLLIELRNTAAQLSQSQEESVLLLAAAAEAHDRTTGLHLQSVRELTEALARELDYADADAIALGLASVLHDIGKIRVPDTILTSPTKLEGSHWETMKQHTIWGADFLEGHPGFELATIVALRHHERWDGGGYPGGIAGDAIPEAATIVAVADAFDAITHNRPYRAGRPADEAVTEIAAHSGRQFNPKVVAALERLHQRNELPAAYPEVSDTEIAA